MRKIVYKLILPIFVIIFFCLLFDFPLTSYFLINIDPSVYASSEGIKRQGGDGDGEENVGKSEGGTSSKGSGTSSGNEGAHASDDDDDDNEGSSSNGDSEGDLDGLIGLIDKLIHAYWGKQDESTPTPTPTPDPTPTIIPPTPPCAKWDDYACEEIQTSLGSEKIKTNTKDFIMKIFSIILAFAGGIALFLIISAGYKLMVSKGKPEEVQQAREKLISAIVGLAFIIFAFVIFEVIAQILNIPGISM